MAKASNKLSLTAPSRLETRLAIVAVFLAATTAVVLPAQGRAALNDADEADDLEQKRGRIEAEYAEKVEEYNDLLKQKRIDKALAVAKQAQLLRPENPLSELMVVKAKFARQEGLNAARRLVVFDFDDAGQQQARIAEGGIAHLVFGDRLDAAAARAQLDARLAQKIASLDQICGLTSAQKQRLQLAGRGDIKRFFDRLESLQSQIPDGRDADDQKVQEWVLRLRVEAATLQRTLHSGVFEEGSLFAKILKTTLTPDQAAAYEKAPRVISAIRWIDPVGKKVWIALGGSDGVQPGATYRILKTRPARQGSDKPQAERIDEAILGTIEVTRVLEENLSEARILEEDADNPIAKGDSVVPKRPNVR